jgi:hypothetical protein
MKKLTLVLCSVLFTSLLFAQQTNYEVGIEGGPSLISLWGDENVKEFYDPTIGFSGALTFQYNLTKTISLRTNFAYERKGASLGKIYLRDINNIDLGYVKLKNFLSYLTLPILIKAQVGDKIKYFANGGIFFGYLMKQTLKRTDNSISFTIDDETESYNRLDVGTSIGGGIAIPVGDKFIVSGEIRENLGLLSISKGSTTIRTTSTNLLFGFAYKIGSSK